MTHVTGLCMSVGLVVISGFEILIVGRAKEAERLRTALLQAKGAEKDAKRKLLDLTSSPGLVSVPICGTYGS